MDALTARTARTALTNLPSLLGRADASARELTHATPPQAVDRDEAPTLAWLLRSEAFPEDLEPGPSADGRRSRLTRRHRTALLWGLGLPLGMAVIGLGSWLGLA